MTNQWTRAEDSPAWAKQLKFVRPGGRFMTAAKTEHDFQTILYYEKQGDLYEGTCEVYRSPDGKNTWIQLYCPVCALEKWAQFGKDFPIAELTLRDHGPNAKHFEFDSDLRLTVHGTVTCSECMRWTVSIKQGVCRDDRKIGDNG